MSVAIEPQDTDKPEDPHPKRARLRPHLQVLFDYLREEEFPTKNGAALATELYNQNLDDPEAVLIRYAYQNRRDDAYSQVLEDLDEDYWRKREEREVAMEERYRAALRREGLPDTAAPSAASASAGISKGMAPSSGTVEKRTDGLLTLQEIIKRFDIAKKRGPSSVLRAMMADTAIVWHAASLARHPQMRGAVRTDQEPDAKSVRLWLKALSEQDLVSFHPEAKTWSVGPACYR